MTPTDDDLYDLAAQFHGDPVPAMRRALELWGNQSPPRPIPLSERKPESSDLDAEGRCWLLGKIERDWRLFNVRTVFLIGSCFSHWLPANALLLPEGQADG